ncbi:MAG: selenium cofactor biosynthesis protein YqeC [Dehalococcoidia bacterium]
MTGTTFDETSMWDALGLGESVRPVVAIVGGGGKTALLYRLGVEAEARGVRAVLGGTTRFTPAVHSPMPPLVEADDASMVEAVQAALDATPVVVVSSGDAPQGRFSPVAPETVDALARIDGIGLVAVEADGSKMRPFKAPGEHEPVIPASTTHVVAVVGADAVGAPIDEAHVHRPERVRAILERRGLEGDVATPEAIAAVLLDEEGGRRAVDGRAFIVVVNKAESHPEAAAELASALEAAGATRFVLAELRSDAPVRSIGPRTP